MIGVSPCFASPLFTLNEAGLSIELQEANKNSRLTLRVGIAKMTQAQWDEIVIFPLTNPSRIVIDIPNSKRAKSLSRDLSHSVVKRLRLGGHTNKSRIVLDLGAREEPKFTVEKQLHAKKLLVHFGTPITAPQAATPQLVPQSQKQLPPEPKIREANIQAPALEAPPTTTLEVTTPQSSLPSTIKRQVAPTPQPPAPKPLMAKTLPQPQKSKETFPRKISEGKTAVVQKAPASKPKPVVHKKSPTTTVKETPQKPLAYTVDWTGVTKVPTDGKTGYSRTPAAPTENIGTETSTFPSLVAPMLQNTAEAVDTHLEAAQKQPALAPREAKENKPLPAPITREQQIEKSKVIAQQVRALESQNDQVFLEGDILETQQKSNLLEIVLSMLVITLIAVLVLRRDAIFTLIHAKAAGPKHEPLVLQIERTIDDCYSVLGCHSADTDDEIKARYRHLVKVFHTDKLDSDLPGELIELSTEQFRRVQEAYDQIREMRGFP